MKKKSLIIAGILGAAMSSRLPLLQATILTPRLELIS